MPQRKKDGSLRRPIAPPPEVRQLGQAVLAAIHAMGWSSSQLSGELGRHANYLPRALAGTRRLRVDIVFAVLGRLDQVPELFFDSVFPLGQGAYAQLRSHVEKAEQEDKQLHPEATEVPDLRDTIRRLAREQGELSPREQELRTGELLRFVLQRSGHSLRGASRALGLTEDALGHVLRGAARLTFFHVFGVLRYVGMSPGRFFFELFLDRPQSPEEWHPRAELLDVIEKLVESTAQGLLERMAHEDVEKVELQAKEKTAK